MGPRRRWPVRNRCMKVIKVGLYRGCACRYPLLADGARSAISGLAYRGVHPRTSGTRHPGERRPQPPGPDRRGRRRGRGHGDRGSGRGGGHPDLQRHGSSADREPDGGTVGFPVSPASPASPASTGGQLLISPYADFARAQAGDAYMSALCDPRAGLRPVDGLRQFGCRQGEQLLVAGPACGQGIVEGAVAPGSRMVCSRPPDRDRVSSTAVSFLAADVSQHPA